MRLKVWGSLTCFCSITNAGGKSKIDLKQSKWQAEKKKKKIDIFQLEVQFILLIFYCKECI